MTEEFNTHNLIEREQNITAHNYHPLPVILAHGKGVWVWDIMGKRYLDMMSGYSAVSLGHCHPIITRTLKEQSNKLCVPSRAFYSDQLVPYLEKLCLMTGMDRALPMNTGAEAVETAIKAARRWGYQVKGIPDNQAEIIVADNNFHGRTTTIVGFSTDPNSKQDFGPFSLGFSKVPFGKISDLEQAITDKTCAVLIEPIQGEAGVIVPPDGYLKDLSRICQHHNVLLILDEVQSGLARTGKMFAFEHEGIKPDGLILGKALGGGILPVSAFLSRKDVMDTFNPGSHGSTFGGNPLACAVALQTLKLLESENLPDRSKNLGEHLKQKLLEINHPLVKEVRGKGLWIGLELTLSGRDFCKKLMENNILTKETHETTIRLAPPLIITQDELDWSITQIHLTLDQMLKTV